MKRDRKRKKPYVWPSWLTKLIAGEDQCWWKAWYKSRYRFSRVPDEDDRAAFFEEYNKKHDAIVARRAQELRDLGFVVKVEDEGAFRLEGETADVSGKPDIVAIKENPGYPKSGGSKGKVTVVDAKAGKPRKSDHWQVLLYQLALILSWLGDGYEMEGEVEYQSRRDQVKPLGEAEKRTIVDAIKKVSSSEEPPAVPSQWECKYCDVAACPVRYTQVVSETELF